MKGDQSVQLPYGAFLKEIRALLDLITLVTLLQSGILILKPPHITWKIFEHLVRLQHYYWGRKDTSQLRKKVNRVATEVLKDIADQHHLDYKVHTLRDMKKRVSGPLKKAIERIDEETQKLLPNVIFVNNWFAQHIISRRWAGLRKDAREFFDFIIRDGWMCDVYTSYTI